jgi:hypothetical protein
MPLPQPYCLPVHNKIKGAMRNIDKNINEKKLIELILMDLINLMRKIKISIKNIILIKPLKFINI